MSGLARRVPLRVDEQWVEPYWISELFPGARPRAVSLRAVFFLGGFADRASLAPFQLTLNDAEVITWLAQPAISYCSWGLAPERRALRLLALRQALSRVPCWMVKVGTPRDTTNLIELTMEKL